VANPLLKKGWLLDGCHFEELLAIDCLLMRWMDDYSPFNHQAHLSWLFIGFGLWWF
jgi:hypothetical protein